MPIIRCSICGKFIGVTSDEVESKLITPDSDRSSEVIEIYHIKCKKEEFS